MKKLLLIFFWSALLISCNIDQTPKSGCISGNCTSGRGNYIFKNGTQYDGDWRGGLMHGIGSFLNVNGDIDVSVFKEGKKLGWSLIINDALQNTKIGYWVNDSIFDVYANYSHSTKKIIYNPEHDIEDCPVGMIEKHTKYYSRYDTEKEVLVREKDNMQCFSRCIDGGCINGEGTQELFIIDEERFIDWHEYHSSNYLSGFYNKKLLLENRINYSGNFKRGIRNGKGKLLWLSETTKQEYIGGFLNGVRSGYGEYIWAQSYYDHSYKGKWKKDKKHGLGIFKCDKYEAIGCNYEGSFKDGFFHGEGKLEYQKGEFHYTKIRNQLVRGRPFHLQEGTFKDGSLSYGTIQGGRERYEGHFLDGKFNGRGTYYDNYGKENETKFVGTFDCCNYDKQRQTGIQYNADGTTEEGTWETTYSLR